MSGFKKCDEGQRLMKIKRKNRIKRMMEEQGITNQQDIATILGGEEMGCDGSTVSKYMKEIRREIIEEDAERSKSQRGMRIRQFEHVSREALNAFKRSQETIEEISTTYQDVVCPTCSGSKTISKKVCSTCKGEGVTTIEKTTKRTMGRPGEAAFLNVMRSCLVQCSKLEGLIGNYTGERTSNEGVILHAHVHQNVGDNPFSNCSPEQLIDLKKNLAKVAGITDQRQNRKAARASLEDIENLIDDNNPAIDMDQKIVEARVEEKLDGIEKIRTRKRRREENRIYNERKKLKKKLEEENEEENSGGL